MAGYLGQSQPVAAGGNSVETEDIIDGAVTAAKLAPGAAVPSQSTHNGKFLTTDGDDASWATVDLSTKVDKVTGKVLSANDFTNTLKTKLDNAASTTYVDAEVSGLVDSAPATLNTLNELALALGDDANHVTTMTTLIGGKLPLTGGSLSGSLNVTGNLSLSTSDGFAYLSNVGTGNNGIYVRGIGAQNILRSHSTGAFTWEVTGGEKMRMDSSGNVGIGTSSPTQKLDVAGVIKAQDLLIRGTVGGAESEAIYYGSQMRVHHDGQTCSDGLTRIAVGRTSPALAIKNTGTNPALHIQGGVLKFPDGTTMSTAATTLSYTAPAYDGGWALYEDDTSSVVAGFDVNIDWKTVKKFVVDKPGSIRVTYEAYITSGQRYFAIRAYSAATGTVHNIHSHGTDLAPGVTDSVHAYREFSYVINNLNAGDLIELQGVTTPGNTAPILSTSSQPLYMKALKLRANEPATVINGVNISEAYWDGSSTTPSPNTLGAGMEINGTTIGAHFDRGQSYDAYIKLTNMPTDDFTLDFKFYITSNVVHSQTDPAGLLWFNTDVASFTAVHYNDSTIKLGGGGWFSGGYDYAKSGQGWWRVTISKSGDTWKYWVEGDLVYTENLPSSSVTSTWWFSNYSAHGGNSNNHYHRGYIDEIKVYASASIAETL